jgi:hypothetical protein
MSALPAKLAGFAAALAVLFGGGALAGGLLDASAPGGQRAATSASAGSAAEMGGEAGAGGGHGSAAEMGGEASGQGGMQMTAVRGLGVAERGLRIVVADADLRRGATEPLRFHIVDTRGRAVRDFDVEHTKRMHLIVARRDLTGFQHLHPAMRPDGTWTTPLRLSDAGSYRVFADFSHGGTPTTLASDLRVSGPAELHALPAPTATATTAGGYEVRLTRGAAHAGDESSLRFAISRDGKPVRPEPYLGAGGHLVALRDGDLAFLHVHPVSDRGDAIGFDATFPTPGAYRLFLQFKVAGTVQTAAFTEEVAQP